MYNCATDVGWGTYFHLYNTGLVILYLLLYILFAILNKKIVYWVTYDFNLTDKYRKFQRILDDTKDQPSLKVLDDI